MEVSLVGTEHIPAIQSIAYNSWPDAYRQILSSAQIDYMLNLFYSRDALLTQMNQSKHRFIMIHEDDKAAGFASWSPKKATDNNIFRLHKLYIDPSFQGKGLGNQLLDHILNSINSIDAKALELNVNRQNQAIHFYQKKGFIILHEEDIDIGNGYFMNDYVMVKTL
jgi:ribosomal protein S18 acetylase RimI-like enzyme